MLRELAAHHGDIGRPRDCPAICLCEVVISGVRVGKLAPFLLSRRCNSRGRLPEWLVSQDLHPVVLRAKLYGRSVCAVAQVLFLAIHLTGPGSEALRKVPGKQSQPVFCCRMHHPHAVLLSSASPSHIGACILLPAAQSRGCHSGATLR